MQLWRAVLQHVHAPGGVTFPLDSSQKSEGSTRRNPATIGESLQRSIRTTNDALLCGASHIYGKALPIDSTTVTEEPSRCGTWVPEQLTLHVMVDSPAEKIYRSMISGYDYQVRRRIPNAFTVHTSDGDSFRKADALELIWEIRQPGGSKAGAPSGRALSSDGSKKRPREA